MSRRRRDYYAYLKSPEWQVCRRMMLDHARHRCQLCNGTRHLQVHHRTYERLGREHFQDLIVLCDACHAKHHDKPARYPDLRIVEDTSPPRQGIAFPTKAEIDADWRWRRDRATAHEKTCHCCAKWREAHQLENAA